MKDPSEAMTARCDGCGKKVPRNEIRNLRLKTCCSFRMVPACEACREKMRIK